MLKFEYFIEKIDLKIQFFESLRHVKRRFLKVFKTYQLVQMYRSGTLEY